MPLLAILLSVLGLVPFIVCGLAALGPDPDHGGPHAERADRLCRGDPGLRRRHPLGLRAAVAPAGQRSSSARGSGLASSPPLVGWIALLLPLVAASWVSLIVLIAAYIGAVLVEQEAAKRDLLPPRYLWLRWGFTWSPSR